MASLLLMQGNRVFTGFTTHLPNAENVCKAGALLKSGDAASSDDESVLWAPLPARQAQRFMSAPMKRYPLTSDQKRQLDEDLTKVDDRLQEIIILMRATYGEESQAVVRAEETAASLQRLKWVLERTQQRRQAAR